MLFCELGGRTVNTVHTKHLRRVPPLQMLMGLSLGYFLVLLDMTVMSVALPAIHAHLGGGLTGLQWVVNAYTIVFAGLLLSMGSISDKYGAKRVYVTGLAVFLVSSVASTAVPSLDTLIMMRAILGIGAAALTPSSLALLAHAFPEPVERARALGIWAAVTGISMAAGPMVGGVLVDFFGWRSIFLLNVSLSILSLVLTMLFLRETPRNEQKNVDLAGQITAFAVIASLTFALMEGGVLYSWSSPIILTAFALALICAVIFLVVEAKGTSPLLPLEIFKNVTVSGGMFAGIAINIGLAWVLFVIPLFLEQVRGLPAHTAGLALLPMMVPLAFNPILTGRITARIGPKIPMTVGFTLAGTGTLLQVWTDTNTNDVVMLISLLLMGIGVSFTIPAMISAVISAVPKQHVGAASGALNSSRQLGAALGIALLGPLLKSSTSFVGGMRVSFVVTTVVLLAGSLLSLLLIGKRNHR
jgi:MFS transporter, DHA2 family, methylenomycin A resistance protein